MKHYLYERNATDTKSWIDVHTYVIRSLRQAMQPFVSGFRIHHMSTEDYEHTHMGMSKRGCFGR